MIVLHLLPSSPVSAAARQVELLAPALKALNIDVHFATLDAGRPVDAPGWWRLRRQVRGLRPDVVHAWRLPALRAAGLLRRLGRQRFRLMVSEPGRGGHVNPLDRRLLRSTDGVVAGYPAEAAALRRFGIVGDRIRELPPVVAPPADPAIDSSLPPDCKLIVCAGMFDSAHGFRDALWAADILRYVVRDLRLVIVGDGPDRAKLAAFVRGVNRAGESVHLLPSRADAAAVLARADVVWVPSRKDCGRQVLLEAMAAGRPVVASALPSLAAVVTDGETGLLTRPADPVALAKRTRRLFEDPAFAARLGAGAREAVTPFTPANAAAAYAEFYRKL